MLLCPVCHEPLVDDERGAACAGGHRFDRAREGYLYLLRSSKSGDSMGDPKSQARSRRDFLNRGYYAASDRGGARFGKRNEYDHGKYF